ncbi:MAG TPA: oxidoreductase [Candidatus Limnocylindria bacterium]|nr:oxidoreductase [Candidatus Limnocylindria bacterium]
MAEQRRPRVGVVKLASCDGCQLTLLDLEDELIAIGQRFDLVEFPEATSRRSAGPYDVLLVEGSISTPEQLEQIVELRARSKLLVTIGACATAGGIQAMRNWSNEPEWRASVYPNPEDVESLATATPVADHVTVDAELRGCPIDGRQLLELLTALRLGRRPQLPDEAVCNECKRLGRVCVLVASDLPCLGPLTATGCRALCPGYNRACYACFGPKDAPNTASLSRWLADGRAPAEVDRLFAFFNGYAPAFREASERAVAVMQPATRRRAGKGEKAS